MITWLSKYYLSSYILAGNRLGKMAQSEEETIKAFISLGLSEQKAKETLKNASVTKTLLTILHEVCIVI